MLGPKHAAANQSSASEPAARANIGNSDRDEPLDVHLSALDEELGEKPRTADLDGEERLPVPRRLISSARSSRLGSRMSRRQR